MQIQTADDAREWLAAWRGRLTIFRLRARRADSQRILSIVEEHVRRYGPDAVANARAVLSVLDDAKPDAC